MKANSFLDMVTLLVATARTDNEIHSKISKLILLYNKPAQNLGNIFSNIHQLDICANDYFDSEDNTFHFDDEFFIMNLNGKQHIHKAPKSINDLIIIVNNTDSNFTLEFKKELINKMGFSNEFIELMDLYDQK